MKKLTISFIRNQVGMLTAIALTAILMQSGRGTLYDDCTGFTDKMVTTEKVEPTHNDTIPAVKVQEQNKTTGTKLLPAISIGRVPSIIL